MVGENIFFGIISAVMVVAAFRVVTTKNVVHAGLLLAITMAGVAAIYVLLAAEFVVWVQVIVYIGAIAVLLLFGTMLTRAPIGRVRGLDNDQRWLGALVALLLLGILSTVLWQAFGHRKLHVTSVQRAAQISDSIFGPYVIPFEVVSVLLLAALIGAIAIARRD